MVARTGEIHRQHFVEAVVLFVLDFARRPPPDRLLLVGRLFVIADENRESDIIRMPAHNILKAEGAREFVFVVFEMQGDAGAADFFFGALQAEIRAAGGRPLDGRVARAERARDHIDLPGDHESGIKADAKLTDDVGGVVGFVPHRVDEGFGARLGDGAQPGDDLVAVHADARVADRQGLRLFVKLNVNLQLGLGVNDIVIRQPLELEPIQGVRRIGDQLAQEDLFFGVQRVNQDIQQLLRFGLKCELLAHVPSLLASPRHRTPRHCCITAAPDVKRPQAPPDQKRPQCYTASH